MQREVKGSKPYARLATREDALELSKTLREEDRLEVEHASGMTAEVALRYCLAVSNIAYAVIKEGRVVALMGISEDPHWDTQRGVGRPWMLASEELKTIRKSFLRDCRGYLESWLEYHGYLEGYVWTQNAVHIKWLEWLGFQFDPPAPFGINNELFMRFHMTQEGIGGA